MPRKTLADDAAQVEESQPRARHDRLGHTPFVAVQRPPLTEGADDDVALLHETRAAVDVLEGVVMRLVVEDADREDGAFGVEGVRSPHALLDAGRARYGESSSLWDGRDAEGFCRVTQAAARLYAGTGEEASPC